MQPRFTLALCACTLMTLDTCALEVFVNTWSATCGNSTGAAVVSNIIGGQPPYSIQWSTGAQTDTITGLAPGAYSVTVTDANSDQASQNFIIVDLANPVLDYSWTSLGLHNCHGQCNGGIWYDEQAMPLNLVPPFNFSTPPTYGINPFNLLQGAWVGFCPEFSGTFTTVTDALGCVAQMQILPYEIPYTDPSPMSIVSVTPSCEGMNGGTIVVNVGVDDGAVGPNWEFQLLDAAMQPVPGVYIPSDPVVGWNSATITNRPPGDYFIERRFQNLYSGDCVDLLPVTVPSLGPDCGIVSGTAFIDDDLNCLALASEVRVPQGFVEVQPGPYYAPLMANGTYVLSLPTGSYSVSQWSPSVVEHCTGSPIPFDIAAGTTVVRNLPDTSVVPLDLEVTIASGAARPGFEFQYGITVRNLTPTTSDNTTLTFTFDPLLTFFSATPNGSVVDNTVTRNQGALGAWQQRNYIVRFNVPADPGLLGTELVGTATVSSVATDGYPDNNTATNYRTITGSYDPNDKLARTSLGSSSTWYIDGDEWIDYTIRFQNTGTDTAFNILVTDTLAAELDPVTIQMGAASHPFTWELRENGTLKFYFQNILLVDSNYSEPMSHGFVGFRIQPRLPLLPGTVIANTANIYFDFNPPVITEPSVLVAEFSTAIPYFVSDGIRVQNDPAQRQVVLTMPAAWMGNGHWQLLASDGRSLRNGRISGERVAIPWSENASGIYLITVTDPAGNRHAQRINIEQS